MRSMRLRSRCIRLGFWPCDWIGRNSGTDAGLMQAGADGVGIVALVGEKIGGPLLGQGDCLFECRAVRRFAGREVEDGRDASPFSGGGLAWGSSNRAATFARRFG